MKIRFLLLLLFCTSCGVAFNRTGDPNQDVFMETLAYLERDYNGFNTTLIPNLERFRESLERQCRELPNPCPIPVVEAGIDQMIASLNDAHTYYQNPELAAEPSDYARFGMFVRAYQNTSDVWISTLEPNAVAALAGLKRGDRIVTVNGQGFAAYAPRTPRQVLRALGKTQNPVRIGVIRAGQNFEVILTGQRQAAPVPYLQLLEAGVGILKIPSFAPGTAQMVHDLVMEAQNKGVNLLVLDLRDNLGGRVTETVLTQIAFVAQGGYLQETKTGLENAMQEGACRANGTGNSALSRNACWKGKLVVLVNQFSASGSEYVAQLLQEENRAKVIGEPTYGVGNTSTRGVRLQNGALLTISFARSRRLSDNAYLPAIVQPNQVLLENPDRLQLGFDDLMAAALGQSIATQRFTPTVPELVLQSEAIR